MGNIIKKGFIIDSYEAPSGKATFLKHYEDDELEINTYKLIKNERYYMNPPKNLKGLKVYQIIQGALRGINSQQKYGIGDIILLRNSDDAIYIYSEEETEILVYSYNENAFEYTKYNFQIVHDTMMKIQTKDNYTNEHSNRVYEIIQKMCEVAGYEGDRLHNSVFAARYHDVGKVFIPDDILNKPSELTDEEYEVMKKHVIKGEEFLKKYYNDKMTKIVLQHHERLDGSGYPAGLKEDEILEEAKMLAVVDSFDAMTSKRVYKNAKPREEAIQELYQLSGKYYDKRYVDLLLEVIK